jgi:hypothetical protein
MSVFSIQGKDRLLAVFVDCMVGAQMRSPPPQPHSYPSPPPQACQAAIDQIEKRNETFKAAAQGPEGDVQEQEVRKSLPPLIIQA